MQYLVCEKCGGFYKLKPEESPEDFTDQCECGGKLKVVESIEEFENTSNKKSRQNKTKTGFDKDYFKWRWLWSKY